MKFSKENAEIRKETYQGSNNCKQIHLILFQNLLNIYLTVFVTNQKINSYKRFYKIIACLKRLRKGLVAIISRSKIATLSKRLLIFFLRKKNLVVINIRLL